MAWWEDEGNVWRDRKIKDGIVGKIEKMNIMMGK